MGRLFLLGAGGWFVAMACGGNLTTGCPTNSKECMIGGTTMCVAADDPKYGCMSSTCLSCGGLSNARHVKVYGCDATRGGCVALVCQDGYQHCTEGPPSQCETNIASDVAHCGDCGKACSLVVPNGMPSCVHGQCVASCRPGFFDCDQQIDNGCECAEPMHCDGQMCAR